MQLTLSVVYRTGIETLHKIALTQLLYYMAKEQKLKDFRKKNENKDQQGKSDRTFSKHE
jgi:hypothetical protein